MRNMRKKNIYNDFFTIGAALKGKNLLPLGDQGLHCLLFSWQA